MNDTLKLADECEQSAALPTSLYAEAAAELRRLHELAESEGRWASDYLQRAVKAEAINAKLLEALEDMLGWQTLAPDGVVAAARAAIEQYDQTSLELCKECGWKALIPGDGCLVCARQKAKPVAWMYDFLNSDNRDEVIRNWVTQSQDDIKRENGFNVRPLYTAPPATTHKPVAYVDQRIHGWPDCFVMEPDPPHTVPLYTAPRQWVELTDDEARALVNRATFGDRTNWQALVYMVDAKLKERNA
jgi:hypothetical protein